MAADPKLDKCFSSEGRLLWLRCRDGVQPGPVLFQIKKKIFNGLAIDGKYTEWKESECSATCGGGVITKTRTCTNPAPQHGGKDCSGLGPAEMTLSCNEQECRKLI